MLHNLQEAGLDAGDFHWELHTAFLGLLGLTSTPKEEDKWLDRYVALLQIYLRLPLDLYLELLPEIAKEIVGELKWEKGGNHKRSFSPFSPFVRQR